MNYTEADICNWYLAGDGCPAIQARIGRSQCYVDAVLARNGVQKRGPGRQPDRPRPERRTPPYKLEAAVARYVAGESAKSIGECGDVSKTTLLRELRRRGIEIRMQRLDLPVDPAAAYSAGNSANAIAGKLGVSKKLVLRRLAEVGVSGEAIRAHVRRYAHESPTAGRVVVRGTWEKAYAIFLDRLWRAGAIASWQYEPERIRLEDGRIYIPDFLVTSIDGAKSFHEVKGRLTSAAMSKISGARALGRSVALLRASTLRQIFRAQGLRAAI